MSEENAENEALDEYLRGVDLESYEEYEDGYDDFDLDDEEYELDPEYADLPELSEEDVQRPEEHEGGQDDEALEGLGAIPRAPRSWKEALRIAASYVRNNRSVTPGYCLRETRQYYGVGPYYPAAKDSAEGARRLGKLYRVTNYNKIPRGAIVYWTGGGSQYGHVAPCVGAGRVISTDWPRGKYGFIKAETLKNAWGYDNVYWSPLVNDVRVWSPKRKKPKKPKRKRINRARVNRTLKHPGKEKWQGDLAMEQLDVIVKALRKRGWSVKGYPKHINSARRAISKFQRHQGWRGEDANGLVGPGTCKRLGVRSHWNPLPEWGKK